MNRTEAHQQLLALAKAMREGHILDPRDYPVLEISTRDGLPLWRVNGAHLLHEGWSYERSIAWVEHEAINELVLADE
jgi:hypothetical protein